VKERRDFSVTGGMCPRCEGMGRVDDIDLSALYDETGRSTRAPSRSPAHHGRLVRPHLPRLRLVRPGQADPRLHGAERHDLLHKESTKIKVEGLNLTYLGLVPQIQKSFLSKDVDALQPHIRAFVERAVTFQPCPSAAGHAPVRGGPLVADPREEHRRRLLDADQRPGRWVRELDEPSVAPLLTGLQHLLDAFAEIGLGYLSLGRRRAPCPAGEAQRTKMIRHLGSSLTDVTYVFDEPTIGLHPTTSSG
jgi:excinuclease UvrABC ATPase subunit